MSDRQPRAAVTALWLLAALPGATFADDTARMAEIYVEELSRNSKDPAELARRLVHEAGKVTGKPALRSALYQKAYEYGVRTARGHEWAVAAMEAAIKTAADPKPLWRDQLAKACQLAYARKSRAERGPMGEKLLSALAEAGSAYLRQGLPAEASKHFGRAVLVARSLSSAREAEMVQKARRAHALIQAQKSIEQWEARLKRNAQDAQARMGLLRGHVLETDTPARAQPFLDASVPESWRRHVPLAVRDLAQLDAAACRDLGRWYASLARGAAPTAKGTALSRAVTYYRQYLKLHPRPDLERLQAEKALADTGMSWLNLVLASDTKVWLPMPKTVTLTVGTDVTMKLVLIPGGKFLMGSPRTDQRAGIGETPPRTVTISPGAPGFCMGVTEVTQAQWKAVMGTDPWKGKTKVKEGDDYPACYVNWNEAVLFCRKLSRSAGATVRLPTEAEWEYACRAGTTTRYSFGDSELELGDYAWYDENAEDVDEGCAHPVARKKPNAWGLYDMHGNVSEWCWDWYSPTYYAAGGNAVDPTGPRSAPTESTGSTRSKSRYSRRSRFGRLYRPPPPKPAPRVGRGGAMASGYAYCRSASRFKVPPESATYALGFRVVLSQIGRRPPG